MNNTLRPFLIRENMIKIIREFFYAKAFHEVIPPLLNSALPLEPHLKPFKTEGWYLPHSPERGIKKMLAEGIGNCFALSKSFRNYEQTGPFHMNEFLMLEWYRVGVAYGSIMEDAESLLLTIEEKMEQKIPLGRKQFPRVSLNTLFEKICGISLESLLADEPLIKVLARKKGYTVERATWEELYDQLFVNEIESTFKSEPFFLVDFPARISPLCKPQENNPQFAERFELYVSGVELGNGNTENTDTKAIREVFEKEQKKTGMPIDEEFLSSLALMNNESYAGMGIGIDRLVMHYTKTDIFV